MIKLWKIKNRKINTLTLTNIMIIYRQMKIFRF